MPFGVIFSPLLPLIFNRRNSKNRWVRIGSKSGSKTGKMRDIGENGEKFGENFLPKPTMVYSRFETIITKETPASAVDQNTAKRYR